MSISFSPHPDGKFICSICGKDYLAWNDDPEQRCSHLAFVNYDEGEGESQRCFVWVENAHAFEGSLVYKGATPGAMVRKAQFYAPQLAKEQIGWLEERYQVRLLDASVHPAAQLELDETPPTEDRGDAEKEARMRAKITETIKARLGEQRAAELMAIEDDIQFTAESLRALTEAHEVAILQLEADSIALEARIAELTPNAELGAAYKADLVAEVVKARVQAQGSEFDAEMYRKVLMSQSDLAFIKSERATWQERAAEAFKSGRQFRLEEPQKPVRAPLAAYSG
jgi:vacuolar-type H+-ATPase subunit I/STV1